MKILVTGAVGFIGFHITKKLLEKKHFVVGIDNFNIYYDIKLKKMRYKFLKKNFKKNLLFFKRDLKNYKSLKILFKKQKFDLVINLAAQAGVRLSIKQPDKYFESNIIGFYNLLNCCVKYKIKHLVSSSSSSVYGEQKNNTNEDCETSKPLSFYAASKKSNEIMAYSFSKIYNLPIIMLRYFTVYGPWGRPDMALYKFTEAILKNKTFKLYNNGNHYRDFTYIDDIVDGTLLALKKIPKIKDNSYHVFNLANNKTINLKVFVKKLEKHLNKKANYKVIGLQKGDVYKTSSDISKAKKYLGYKPKVDIDVGISKFLLWYKKYHNLK